MAELKLMKEPFHYKQAAYNMVGTEAGTEEIMATIETIAEAAKDVNKESDSVLDSFEVVAESSIIERKHR